LREICPDRIVEKANENIEKHTDKEKNFKSFKVENENQDAFTKVKNWRKSEFQTLIIYGSTGRGKTHLAKAVQLEFLKDFLNTAFITSEALYETFINAQPSNDYDIDVHQVLADIRGSALFVLDDLGAERKTTGSFFEEQLKKMMDERHGRAIITTNLSTQELSSRYNEKIISRLMENSITVHLRGKDYRRGK
jgi:DNA replication protein DnaC